MYIKKLLVLIMFLTSFNIFAQSANGKMSYEIKLGKYNILQYRANVRSEPNRNSSVIVILNLNDEIEIIENSGIEENINEVWSFWYKIRYGNIEGYTFGGNIALDTFVTDIDNNGIDDYFYFRISNRNITPNFWMILDSRIDIFIYINNVRINTNMLNDRAVFSYGPYFIFDWCKFIEIDNYVLIILDKYGKDSIQRRNIYTINRFGDIEYLEAMSGWSHYDIENGESFFIVTDRYDNNNNLYEQFIERDDKGYLIIRD